VGTGHRDLLVVCGHWADLFSWTTETEICLEFVDTGHRDFLFGFTGFWTTKTEPNRNQSVWIGFGFKILKLIMSVWFIFLCKNRTEPKMISPKFNVELLKLLERLSMEYWNKIPHIELGHKIYAQPLINSVLFRIFKISK